MQSAILEPPTEEEIPGPLSPKDITEFQRIIEEETGVQLTREEAWDAARRVLALYRILLGPLPEDPETSPSNPDLPHLL